MVPIYAVNAVRESSMFLLCRKHAEYLLISYLFNEYFLFAVARLGIPWGQYICGQLERVLWSLCNIQFYDVSVGLSKCRSPIGTQTGDFSSSTSHVPSVLSSRLGNGERICTYVQAWNPTIYSCQAYNDCDIIVREWFTHNFLQWSSDPAAVFEYSAFLQYLRT